MGLSFSKSVKFGPLRVNLSKRGVGVSAGVKGARVSVGPRGTYVTLGSRGFRYQTKLTDVEGSPAAPLTPLAPIGGVSDDGRIQTASATALAEASPDSVLSEIQSRVHRFNWFKMYAVVVLVLALPLLTVPPALIAFLLLVGVPGYFLYRWNRDRRTARLFYDIDSEELVYRLGICNAVGEALSGTARLWHIYSSKAVGDQKRNAGASALISRTVTKSHLGSLQGIQLNVEPWSITVGPQQLLFLPDRLIVHENRRFAAVPYEHLSAELSLSRFIEEEGVPPDAKQVDVTWRYVNKSGGPDRRFNDNKQLPVLQYGRLTLSTPTGMTIVIESSNIEATARAHQWLNHLGQVAREVVSGSEPQARAADAKTPPPSNVHPIPRNHPFQIVHVAVLFRFIAAADRRISDDEVQSASRLLRQFTNNQQEVERTMAEFKALASNDMEARQALEALVRHSKDVAMSAVESARAIAAADGKITPKEQERLGLLESWLRNPG